MNLLRYLTFTHHRDDPEFRALEQEKIKAIEENERMAKRAESKLVDLLNKTSRQVRDVPNGKTTGHG